MPILAVLDEGAHGALDESLKSLYVQNSENKQFYLDLPDSEAEKLAFSLNKRFNDKKADLDRIHKEKKPLESEVVAYRALGPVEELKAKLEANQPENITKMVSDYETKMEALKKSYEEPLNQATEKAKKYEAQIQKSLTDAAIQKLRNEHDLNEAADYVLRDFIKAVPKEEGSDEYTVKVFDNGSPAIVAGQEMKPEQLIAQWREHKKFTPIFNAGDGGGSGGSARQVSTGGGKAFTVSAAASKANPSLYETAKAEAEKVGGTVQWTD